VLLAALGTGFGHLYLRRWTRAVGWVVLAVGTTVLFVPETAVEAFATGSGAEWGNAARPRAADARQRGQRA